MEKQKREQVKREKVAQRLKERRHKQE